MKLGVEKWTRHHDHIDYDYDYGDAALNVFLQRLAWWQSERDFSRTYAAPCPDESRVRGVYAISAGSVDLREQGHGVGAFLLRYAMSLSCALAQKTGLHSLTVYAKSESAAAYCARYGFQRFFGQTLSVFLTTDVIRRAQQYANQLGAQH